MRNTAFTVLSLIGVLTFATAQTHPGLDDEQHGKTIDIVLTENWPGRPSSPMQLHLRIDGEPAINTAGPNKFRSTTHWEHDKLVTFVQGDRGRHMTEVRQLSPDGNTLTVTGYHQDELKTPYYVRVMTRNNRKPH